VWMSPDGPPAPVIADIEMMADGRTYYLVEGGGDSLYMGDVF
jgi:hypothetical protein